MSDNSSSLADETCLGRVFRQTIVTLQVQGKDLDFLRYIDADYLVVVKDPEETTVWDCWMFDGEFKIECPKRCSRGLEKLIGQNSTVDEKGKEKADEKEGAVEEDGEAHHHSREHHGEDGGTMTQIKARLSSIIHPHHHHHHDHHTPKPSPSMPNIGAHSQVRTLSSDSSSSSDSSAPRPPTPLLDPSTNVDAHAHSHSSGVTREGPHNLAVSGIG